MTFAEHYSQVMALASANIKARYRKTVAGFVWVVMNPILMFSAQSMAFKAILKLQIPNFFVFLLGGLLPWIFITHTVDMTCTLLLERGTLLKSFKIHPLTVLWSQIIDNLVNFLAAFFILLAIIMSKGDVSSWHIVLLPIGMLILIVGVAAMCWLVSILQIFYRDVKYVVQFLTSVMFFLTPIFYPISFVPEQYKPLVMYNPFYALIEAVRTTIYQPDLDNIIFAFTRGSIVAVLFLGLAYLNWRRKKNEFYLKL